MCIEITIGNVTKNLCSELGICGLVPDIDDVRFAQRRNGKSPLQAEDGSLEVQRTRDCIHALLLAVVEVSVSDYGQKDIATLEQLYLEFTCASLTSDDEVVGLFLSGVMTISARSLFTRNFI